MRNFDIFICVKDADSNLFSKMISRVIKHIKPQKIVIATTNDSIQKLQKFSDKNIIFLNESEICNGLNIKRVKHKIASLVQCQPLESNVIISRSGWYLQQFLKMAFALYTRPCHLNNIGGGGNLNHNDFGDSSNFSDYYLIWDADAIPLRDMEFFNENGQILVEKASEYHKPYFCTMKSLGIDDRMRKVADFSFISEHLMIERVKMIELINLIEIKHKKPFWEAILEAISLKDLGASGFSEYETYGTFLAINYPQTFIAITRKRDRFAKQLLGANPSEATLSWYGKKYEVCGFESWDSTNQKIARLLKYRIFRLLPPNFYRKIYRLLRK